MITKRIKNQTLLSSLFAFLLTIVLVVLYVCIGFGIGVFNDRSITTSLNQTNYFNKAYEDINRKIEELLTEAGLPATLLEDVINLDKVYVGGKNYVEASLKGAAPQLSLDKLRVDIRNRIKEYLQEEEIRNTDELDRGVEKVVLSVEREYRQGVELKFVDYYKDYQAGFHRVMMVLLPSLFILTGILCFHLIRIHRYKHRGVRYITYAIIASSAITVISAMYLLLTRSYGKLELQPRYYYDFLASFLKRDIMVFAYIGVIGFILSVVLISFIGFLKNRIHNR